MVKPIATIRMSKSTIAAKIRTTVFISFIISFIRYLFGCEHHNF